MDGIGPRRPVVTQAASDHAAVGDCQVGAIDADAAGSRGAAARAALYGAGVDDRQVGAVNAVASRTVRTGVAAGAASATGAAGDRAGVAELATVGELRP